MNEYAIVEKFNQENIKAIINLQQFGEHELCGDGNDPKCGFSYNPQDFMDAGVFHYNFGWIDMSVPTVEYMLNIVQVMSNTLKDPQAKVAVHCHAGLGRTGLTIACYLVFEYNMPPKEAVLVVRKSRPLSLQTRHQVQFVTLFETFLKKLIVIFPFKIVDDKVVVVDIPSLDLRQMIYHQRLYYHNDDLKQLTYVLNVCSILLRLKKLAIKSIIQSLSRKLKGLSTTIDEQKELETAFCEAILSFSNETARISTLEPIIININNGIFDEIETLSVPLLVDLLGLWFLHLGVRFLSRNLTTCKGTLYFHALSQ
jgi:protein tyrosine phosphatase domain-containing protein 1